MSYRNLPLSSLVVNPANDRHGELENETAAIAHLFASQEAHMRSLAKDLVSQREVFEPPLVFPDGDKYIVADGNRRTTCLKLIANPKRAPTVELQDFFSDLKKKWKAPDTVLCRVEQDRERVDEILYRRHTGVQGGVGQSTWDDRMKSNFVSRTGKGSGIHVADEIERLLKSAGKLPSKKIPRSNLNRLLSSEALRNRVGVSTRRGRFEIVRNEAETLEVLQRVADDLASRRVVLDDIWDTDSKQNYLDALDREGVLPGVSEAPAAKGEKGIAKPATRRPPPARREIKWPHLIPNVEHEIVWSAHLQRHREIWEELQFRLDLDGHLNAISVLLRVLLELSIDNYVQRTPCPAVHDNDKLAMKAGKVATQMLAEEMISKKYHGSIAKLQKGEGILSIDTLNRYVHSPNFNVSPEHLRMLWGTLSEFVVLCLKA